MQDNGTKVLIFLPSTSFPPPRSCLAVSSDPQTLSKKRFPTFPSLKSLDTSKLGAKHANDMEAVCETHSRWTHYPLPHLQNLPQLHDHSHPFPLLANPSSGLSNEFPQGGGACMKSSIFRTTGSTFRSHRIGRSAVLPHRQQRTAQKQNQKKKRAHRTCALRACVRTRL